MPMLLKAHIISTTAAFYGIQAQVVLTDTNRMNLLLFYLNENLKKWI